MDKQKDYKKSKTETIISIKATILHINNSDLYRVFLYKLLMG